MITENQCKQPLPAWLSPTDPSTNHNTARESPYKGTTVWLFQGSVIIEWKSTGSLLWIHESVRSSRQFRAHGFSRTRIWQLDQGKASSGLFLSSSCASGLNSPFASSSVIQDIMAVCETGLAIMAYFYFDFRDLDKQTCHDLLLSLVSQLSTRSSSYCDILHRVYEAHEKGTRQPSDDTLKECLR